jgi:hypothetical protein
MCDIFEWFFNINIVRLNKAMSFMILKQCLQTLTADVSKYLTPTSEANITASSRTTSARDSIVPSRNSHLFPTKTPIICGPIGRFARTPL